MTETHYLTLNEAARFLRFDATAPSNPERHVLRFLKRYGVPTVRRGNVTLIERRTLEATLRTNLT